LGNRLSECRQGKGLLNFDCIEKGEGKKMIWREIGGKKKMGKRKSERKSGVSAWDFARIMGKLYRSSADFTIGTTRYLM
jgi:hypothetical protein